MLIVRVYTSNIGIFLPGDLIVNIGAFVEKLGWGTELQELMDRCETEWLQKVKSLIFNMQ